MAPSNPIAVIANDLAFDVDIYDVYNNGKTSQPLLTYQKLATVPTGATGQQVQTIHPASQLQAMRTGSVAALNGNYYEQFPVAVLAVLSHNGSKSFTLASAMQQGMEQSFKFIKYAQANPSSKMAKAFRTALGDTTSQETAVNNFFAGTGSFPLCTMDTWTAVMSWQAQFTSPWQGTYYLYSLGRSSGGGGGGSNNSSSTTGSTAALVATLVIASSAQDSSAKLTMANTNGEGTTVVMTGDGTMQEQDAGIGNLSLTLTPSWLNVTQTSQRSGKPGVTYVIGAAFTGAINGVRVAGNLNQLSIPGPSHNSKGARAMSQAISFILTSLSQVVGMLTEIGMLYYMAKEKKQAETKKENDAQEGTKSKAEADRKVQNAEQEYQQKEVPQIQSQAQQVESTVTKVDDAYAQVHQAQNIQNEEDVVDGRIETLHDVLGEGAPNHDVEDAYQKLLDTHDDLKKATDPTTSVDDRNVTLADASTNLRSAKTELANALADEGNGLSQEAIEQVKNAKNAVEEGAREAETVNQMEEQQEKENEKEADEPVDDKDFDNPREEDPVETGPIEA